MGAPIPGPVFELAQAAHWLREARDSHPGTADRATLRSCGASLVEATDALAALAGSLVHEVLRYRDITRPVSSGYDQATRAANALDIVHTALRVAARGTRDYHDALSEEEGQAVHSDPMRWGGRPPEP